MEALSKKHDKLVLLKVDILNWQSPVAKQFNLRSIPYIEIYGKDGKVKHKGKAALQYLNKLEQKLNRKKS